MLCILCSSTQCGAWGPEQGRDLAASSNRLGGEPTGLSSLSGHQRVEPPPHPVGKGPTEGAKKVQITSL